MKVITYVGTRPEIIKLSRVVNTLQKSFDHLFVHSGQNYDFELNEIFFRDLLIPRPDFFLGTEPSPELSPSGFIAHAIKAFDDVLKHTKPDAVLVLGDTNSGLAALAAKKRRIPIFHMEAGNRCFDLRVPEEVNRRVIDHFSDINLVYTEHARRNLLAEGLPPDRIYLTGSPMREVIDFNYPLIVASNVLGEMKLQSNGYIVASFHREENVDAEPRLRKIVDTLNHVSAVFEVPVILTLHPRTRHRLKQFAIQLPRTILECRPLGFHDYVQLQQSAFCVISDSGTITEESSIVGFPAVNARSAHERPEGIDVGAVPMTGIDAQRVIEGIRLSRSRLSDNTPRGVPAGYEVLDTSHRVANAMLSYTDFVLNQ